MPGDEVSRCCHYLSLLLISIFGFALTRIADDPDKNSRSPATYRLFLWRMGKRNLRSLTSRDDLNQNRRQSGVAVPQVILI